MRRLIAAALSASLMLAAGHAQAGEVRRVNGEAAAAVLFGLATLAIIANQANKDDDDDDERRAERRHDAAEARHRPAHRAHGGPPPRAHGHPARANGHPRYRDVAVPSSCARRVEIWGRTRTAFGTPCLRRNGVNVARLPRRCASDVHVRHRKVTAWGAGCLHRAGVRID